MQAPAAVGHGARVGGDELGGDEPAAVTVRVSDSRKHWISWAARSGAWQAHVPGLNAMTAWCRVQRAARWQHCATPRAVKHAAKRRSTTLHDCYNNVCVCVCVA